MGELQHGDVIDGRYRIEATLGEGGTAVAFRVVDESTGRRLALKRLRDRDGEEPAPERARLRLRHEFHTVARLQHPCIVEVFDYGHADGVPYYTMELLEGPELRKLCPMPALGACSALRDVAAALAFLHARGLIHRDVAPSNVKCAAGGTGRAKLIDFGVIATAGVIGEVAGTPPYIAPESARGHAVDHRVDLFGIGALAYWLLTGRHAFPGRTIDELEPAWRHLPTRPSAHVPNVPPALDELVLSLLSVDPLGRPGTAAEVVDRLSAIGGLEPAPEIETVSGYLASAKLVGRRSEMARLSHSVHKLVDGRGGAAMIEAPAGAGKTRLLREAVLEAQTAGATVAGISGDAGRGPYAVARAIARELLAVAPGDAIDAAQTRVAVIARVLPELRARFPGVAAVPLGGNPREDRMRLQAELAGWIADIAARRPLVIAVDDVQRSDEASSALLATLAHDASANRLLLLVARRTDENARAPETLAALRGATQRLRLLGLERADTEELVHSLFGDGPGIGRVARWMHEWSGGSPLHCIELGRDLVERGAIRFHDGVWSVPEPIERATIPAGLAEALDEHIAQIPQPALSFGEMLSVAGGGDLPLELCTRLVDGPEERVFDMLDVLEGAGVLVRSESGYRFRHDGLREALARRLTDPARVRDLHRRIGHAMLAGAVPPDREADIGWHLLRGGDEIRGCRLLEREARRLYETQSAHDALPLLTAVLDVYERHGEPRRHCLELRQMIIAAGQTCSRDTVLEYADDTIAAFERYAGVGIARKLARIVGARVGLYLGMLAAAIRWLFTFPVHRGPPPVASVRGLLQTCSYTGSAHLASYDAAALGRLIRRIEPFHAMTRRIPNASYLLLQSFHDYMLGHVGSLQRHSDEALHILRTDRRSRMEEVDRKMAMGGLLAMQALANILREYPRRTLAELDRLGLRFFEVAALQVNISYHRFRGEEERAEQLDERAELLFVQLGSMFQFDVWQACASSLAYAHNYDVHGLKRTIERLARLVEAGYRYEPLLAVARGEYYRERGDLTHSRKMLEQALQSVEDDTELILQPARAALAETMLAQGQTSAARELAAEAYEKASDPETERMPYRMRAVRILALAEAELGAVESAGARLDAAIARVSRPGFPSVCGLLHEARARVADRAGDTLTVGSHIAEMERWLRPTRNPALIARIPRLIDQHYAHRADAPTAARARPDSPTMTGAGRADSALLATADTRVSIRHVARAFDRCHTAADRAELALRMIVESTDAAFGYLYVVDAAGSLRLAAPAGGAGAGDDVIDALAAAVSAGDDPSWQSVESPETPNTGLEWRTMLLESGGVVGAVAVARGALRLRPPGDGLCDEIAHALADADDLPRRQAARLDLNSTARSTSSSPGRHRTTSTCRPSTDS